MKFTEEMINEDEKRWYARDVVTELGYCGYYMRDRKDMTNIDIRFYAYIMRKAHVLLKEQEAEIAGFINGFSKDAVPVVRCKDCVYRDNRDGMCEHVQQVRNPDWYCADGERR